MFSRVHILQQLVSPLLGNQFIYTVCPCFVPSVQVSPVRPPHIGEIYRRQKQRSFHGTTLSMSNGGIGGQSVNGSVDHEERRLSGDLESTVDKLRSLLEQREQRQNSASTESKSSSLEHAQQSLSLQARKSTT